MTARPKVCAMCGAGTLVPALSIKQRGRKTTDYFCEKCAPKRLGVTPEEFERLKEITVSTEVIETCSK